jgi:hypothetical protein
MNDAPRLASSKAKKTMNPAEAAPPQRSPRLNHDQLFDVVNAMMDGNRVHENDEQPLPPGPWDPVIRLALEQSTAFGNRDPWTSAQGVPWRSGYGVPWIAAGSQPWRTIESFLGPQPEPWKIVFGSIAARFPAIWDLLGGGPNLGAEVALNPQPLPPRFAFLVAVARTVIGRAELLQEIADATRRESEQQGIIIVSGYLARFVDDICGNGFRFKWPWRWPRPNWFAKEVAGMDLVLIATQFDQAVRETANQELRQHLAHASARLAETGLSKMRS